MRPLFDTNTFTTSYPTPPTDTKSDDSTLNVIQLNTNGIGNKLTELGVVMENNKVKVAMIQESKLTPKSKNPCIQNYTTIRMDRPHGLGGGLPIFIHRCCCLPTPITLASGGVRYSRLWSTSQLLRPSGQQCSHSGGVCPQI